MEAKALLLATSVLFLLTSVSAWVPPVDPVVIDPGITIDPDIVFYLPCECKVGTFPEYCEVGDCAGQRTCESASCILQDGCSSLGCSIAHAQCVVNCQTSQDLCESLCFTPTCYDNCETNFDNCEAGCDDDYDDCAVCDGRWSECIVEDLCCGVNCEANELCDDTSGDCVCADTEERCAADGTGDGVDNDCDGELDEGCTDCVTGATRTCTDINNCSGIQECVAGEWEACQKFNLCCGINCGTNKVCDASTGTCKCIDTVERCLSDGTGDGVDNDCDGDVDEDCSETPVAPAESEEEEETEEEGAEETEGSETEGSEEGTPLESGSETEGSDAGTMEEADIPMSAKVQACHDMNGVCVEQCVGCAPEYLDVCADGYEISGICQPQEEGVLGGTRYVCCVPEGQSTTGGEDQSSTESEDQSGLISTPSADQGVDMDMMMILVIVIVIGVIVVVAIAMLKRNPKPPAPAAPAAPAPPAPPVQ